MYYYYGLHWESQGDVKKQRENMEKALKEDPTNINSLIGYYHIPDLTPDEKRNCVQLIEKSAETFRESIRSNQKSFDDPRETPYIESRESSDCNEFAWLIANTEGNLDEALKYAKRGVELQPASGSIYDTLAQVYFVKGDLENAVKTQDKACELEPHFEMLKKKLEKYKKALADKK
jgi:tetratricopeptide (TPR) repeat protein